MFSTHTAAALLSTCSLLSTTFYNSGLGLHCGCDQKNIFVKVIVKGIMSTMTDKVIEYEYDYFVFLTNVIEYEYDSYKMAYDYTRVRFLSTITPSLVGSFKEHQTIKQTTNRKTNRQTDRQTDRQTNRQRVNHNYIYIFIDYIGRYYNNYISIVCVLSYVLCICV